MNEAKYEVKYTAQFKKEYKLAKKRGLDMKLLDGIIKKLANDFPLDKKHKDHALKGKWKNKRECHVLPDWLLVYQKTDEVLVLDLFRTGTHQDIFGDE
ncbi:MAG: type II toxin-antitoxin system YafQ family toxin [Selenomonadaceae bacterium]|nr:type II toxin-antitoxin system YafQ family toxin [Selenomonadaceae bacterium]